MKRNYSGMDVIAIPYAGSDIITMDMSKPCPPTWVANDTVSWNGFTVCKQMLDESNNWTGQYDVIPD